MNTLATILSLSNWLVVGVRSSQSERFMSLTHARSLLLFLFLALATSLRAEQLPIRTYTAADGLAQNLILRIVRDLPTIRPIMGSPTGAFEICLRPDVASIG